MKTRRVLVTGAAGGIGQAMCRTFRDGGWHVIASDKSNTAKVDCHSYFPLELARFCRDTDYARNRMETLRNDVLDEGLNVLINNAAIQFVGAFESLEVSSWKETLDVNVVAPALLTRELLSLLEANCGAVINIASIHANLTKPGFSAYAASKAGLVGLTRALAVELGGRVRVNAICPAAIATSMLEAGFENGEAELRVLAKHHPSGSLGTPDDVARVARYLAEEECSFINGTVFGLDGGIASRLHDPG